MVKAAIRGNVSAAKHIAEYTEGSPRRTFDVELGIMDELADRIAEGRKRANKGSQVGDGDTCRELA